MRLPAPHVVSIRKGKRAKGTEYGSKGSLAIDRHGFVIPHTEYASNLAAPETLPAALTGWRAVFGRPPPALGTARGRHHPGPDRERWGTAQVARVRIPAKGKRRPREADTAWGKRRPREADTAWGKRR